MRSIPLALSILTIASAVCGCGSSGTASGPGSTTAPTLVSLTRSDNVSLSSSDRLSGAIGNATMTLVFSKAVTVPDSAVTLVCGSTSVSLTLSTSDTITYTLTPASTLPQYSACTLTIAATVVDSNGNAFAQSTTAFNTKCASSDEFDNQDTLSACWSAVNVPANSVMDINTSTPGALTIDNATVVNSDPPTFWTAAGRIYKTVTGDFDVSILISSHNIHGVFGSGISVSAEDPTQDDFFALYWVTADIEGLLSAHYFYHYATYFTGEAYGDGDQVEYTGASLYLRCKRSTDTFTCYASTDGTNWTTVHSITRTDWGNTVSVSIFSDSSDLANGVESVIDYIRFASGGATGQD